MTSVDCRTKQSKNRSLIPGKMIRKFKKVLKFGSKLLGRGAREEERQNERNERLEAWGEVTSNSQGEAMDVENAVNENWENFENWDSCCYECLKANGICLVYMPFEEAPVPVRMRNPIPFLEIYVTYTYGDVEMRGASYATRGQMPQAQRPLFV